MKIKNKMLLGFLAVTSLILIISYLGASLARRAVFTYGEVRNETLPTIAALQNIKFAGIRILSSANEYGLIKAELEAIKKIDKNTFTINMTETLAREEQEIVDTSLLALDSSLQDYRKIIEEYFPEEWDFYRQLQEQSSFLRKAATRLITAKKEESSGLEILELKEELEEVEQNFLETVDAILENERREFRERDGKLQAMVDLFHREVFIGVFVVVACAVMTSIILSTILSRPIENMERVVKLISKGYLNTRVEIDSKDEMASLAQSFNTMISNLEKKRLALEETTDKQIRKASKAQEKADRATAACLEAETKSRLQENIFQTLADNIGIGVVVINPNMEIIAVNNVIRKWIPNIVEGTGEHCYQVFHDPPLQLVCADCPVQNTFFDGQTHETFAKWNLGGRARDVRIISCPVPDTEENIAYVIEMIGPAKNNNGQA